jgi:hypothetical protein
MVRVRRLHALVGPGRSRGDDLSARGLSARYAGSVRSVVEELGGQTLSGLEFGGCLEMIVKVWLRLALLAEHLADHRRRSRPRASTRDGSRSCNSRFLVKASASLMSRGTNQPRRSTRSR